MTGKAKLGPQRGLAVVRPDAKVPSRSHVLAIDGAEAPLLPVELPPRLKGDARLRVARQQIADRLGVSPASLAVLPVERGDTWKRVVVADRQRLSEWAEKATKKCQAILPDYLALPVSSGEAVVTQEGDSVIARLGVAEGFSAPESVAPLLLRRALSETNVARVAIGENVSEGVAAVVRAEGLALRGVSIAPNVTVKPTIDLRDALRDTSTSEGFGTWLLAAGIAALAFGLWVAGLIVETRAIESELASVRDGTEDVLRGGLIPSGPLLDVRAQVTRAMGETRDDDPQSDVSGLVLLSRVTRLVFERAVEVDAIELDATALRLSVTAPDFDVAEALQSDFAADGIPAEIEVLRARDDGQVEARFRMERGT